MAKQAVVIGLGRFGMAVVKALTDRGLEVLAMDSKEDRVREALSYGAEAICGNATDSEVLARISPERRDVCICAIGDESAESAIICAALLRQFGATRVIARASNTVQARILKLIGSHEVINPLEEFGQRFANRIAHEGFISDMPLGEDLVITELRPPRAMVGRTLSELQLRQKFNVTVIAIRQGERGAVILPDPGATVQADHILLVVSNKRGLERMMEGTS